MGNTEPQGKGGPQRQSEMRGKFSFKTFAIIFLIRTMVGKLTDYSDYVPIPDGNVNIWRNFEYLRRTMNLVTYARVTDETEKVKGHFPLSHMEMIPDVTHIRTILRLFDDHHLEH